MLNRERQHPGWHYNQPRALRRRLWFALGYDPLTLRQRLQQVRAEASWWEGRALEAEAALAPFAAFRAAALEAQEAPR